MAFVPATATKGNRYYRCSRRDKEGPESCTMMALVADRIEPVVLARLRDVGSDPALVERVSARLEQRLGEAGGSLEIERRALPGRIASLSTEARRATEALAKANEATPRARLEGLLESVLEELAKAEARLRAVGDELRSLDAAKVESEWVTRTLQDFGAIRSVLTPENRAVARSGPALHSSQ